jgi:YfiH family protein
MKFEMTKNADWPFFRVPELEEKGILHGFCTVDAPSNFLHEKTRQDFLGAFSLKNLVIMNQEHGNDVHVINNGQMPQSGDGLIILEKNIAGIIKTADCLPVILCDAVHPMVSIIHAGWRGTVRKIVRKAVFSMVELGGRTKNIIALLGPSIGPCCYEVKEDVYSAFTRGGFPAYVFLERRNSLFLDLRRVNAWMLQKSGINEVYELDMCTRCNDNLFYSFRRGDTGKRQINFVSLKG